MPYCGHLIDVTFPTNGPAAGSCDLPACFRNPKGGEKLISEVRKQQSCTTLGPLEGKVLVLPSTSDIQVDTHGVLCACETNRPRLTGSVPQRKGDGTDDWM